MRCDSALSVNSGVSPFSGKCRMAGTGASRSRFVGRPETAEALRRRVEDLRAGKGGVTLLVGGTGLGKSTLVSELRREMEARGIRVFLGQAPALDDPPPFSLISAAVPTTRENPLLAPGEAQPVNDDEALLEIAPRLAEAATPSDVGIEQRLLKALDEAEERGKRSRDRALGRIADRFAEITEKGPTALILDDLHRADESSIAAVEFLADHLKDRPLWILATCRPFASLGDERRTRLEEFRRAVQLQEVVLRPLTAADLPDFLKIIEPARTLSPEEAARWQAETGGNPRLIEYLARRGSVDEKTRHGPAPSSPDLDQEAQRTLETAAVLGPEFTLDLLRDVSRENDKHLRELVDRLVAQGSLVERSDGHFEFPDDHRREQAYRRLSESGRRALHQRAGEIREIAGSGGEGYIFDLARDFFLGEGDPKAIQYNQIAAQIAEGASTPDVAREFIERALETQRELDPNNIDAEAKLVLELARVTYNLGRLPESERILRDFLDRTKGAPPLPPRIQHSLEVYLIRVLNARGDLGAASTLARKVLSSPGLEGLPRIRIAAHAGLALTLYYEGRYSESLEEDEGAGRIAREIGDERATARALMWRSANLAMLGKKEEALTEARKVAHLFDRFGTLEDSAQGHLFLGNMLADDRSTPPIREEALAELQKAIRFGAKAQDPRRVGWAFYHSAELLRFEGRAKEAAQNAEQAIMTLERVGDRVGQAVSLKVRGQLAMARGVHDQAAVDLHHAQQLLEGLKDTLNKIDVELRLAQLARAQGDSPRALRHVAELDALHLSELRPDLEEEFGQLKKELTEKDGGPGTPA